MRATDLKFRSPKEKTAEFSLPQVTFDGRFLNMPGNSPQCTFSKAKRFPQYDRQARITSPTLGPGCYNANENLTYRWRVSGTPVYRTLHGDKDTSSNGYVFIGDSLVYEPSFVLKSRVQPRKLKGLNEDEQKTSVLLNSDKISPKESKPASRSHTSKNQRNYCSSPYVEHLKRKCN